MDLRAITDGASWHPFTTVIAFESLAPQRELFFIPHVAPEDGDYSTVLHELTHRWSARTTRLGWLLGKAGADAYTRWEHNPDGRVEVSGPAQAALGAAMPFLEGLALFAQLDYEATTDGEPLASPLAKVRDILLLGHAPGDEELFVAARERALHERALVNILFLDVGTQRAAHYFSGYLYVKALQAWLRQLVPLAHRPAYFLPLAMKILLDHPGYLTLETSADARGLVRSIHEDVRTLSDSEGEALHRLILREDVRAAFDVWDWYGQRAAARYDKPVLFEHREAEGFFGEPRANEADNPAILRACADVHFVSARSGTLQWDDDDALILVADCGDVRLLPAPWSSSWGPQWRAAIEAPEDNLLAVNVRASLDGVDAETFKKRAVASCHATLKRETAFFRALQEAVGRHVEVATFFVSSNGTLGAALWVDEKPAIWYPYSPDPFIFADPLNHPGLDGIDFSLRASPDRRRRFANALAETPGIWDACRHAGDFLLEQLVSDRSDRSVLRHRFGGARFKRLRSAIEAWAAPSSRDAAIPPDPEFIERAATLFDFAGFAGTDHHLPTFQDLLPKLAPPRR